MEPLQEKEMSRLEDIEHNANLFYSADNRGTNMLSDRYKKVYDRGKPKHDPYDDFSIKHPAMELSRRAKIFNPFDALKGFNEEITSTELSFEAKYSDVERVPAEEYP